jgi:hypothetical protein
MEIKNINYELHLVQYGENSAFVGFCLNILDIKEIRDIVLQLLRRHVNLTAVALLLVLFAFFGCRYAADKPLTTQGTPSYRVYPAVNAAIHTLFIPPSSHYL